jgi:hypothetical protein
MKTIPDIKAPVCHFERSEKSPDEKVTDRKRRFLTSFGMTGGSDVVRRIQAISIVPLDPSLRSG